MGSKRMPGTREPEEQPLGEVVLPPITAGVVWAGVREEKGRAPTAMLLPLEEYVTRFSQRYKTEQSFRTIVHQYLTITKYDRVKLAVGKRVAKGWYGRKVGNLMRMYAEKIHTELYMAMEATEELAALTRTHDELNARAGDVTITAERERICQQELAAAAQRRAEELRRVEEQYTGLQQRTLGEAAGAKSVIEQKTDAAALVQQAVKAHIARSPLIKVDTSGQLQFDEQNMMHRLEDLMLKDVIKGIEKEDCKGEFFTTLKGSFDGLISYWDQIEHLGELPFVDWRQSAILSRTKGYQKPQFPYLIAGKGESIRKAKASVDSATIVDTSTSMNENDRMEAARKTVLALHALMRKLSPANESYLAHYNGEVYDVTTREMLRTVQPYNGTETQCALDWLRNKLTGRGPSIANLITDGEPNHLDLTIKAAEKFREHSYILLRIFLIDGNDASEQNIRQIGRAAGPQTKVVAIKGYQLAGGVIRDIAQCIRQMYDIGQF